MGTDSFVRSHHSKIPDYSACYRSSNDTCSFDPAFSTMSSLSKSEDIRSVQEFLGCDAKTAEHYLHCFGGDLPRTIDAALEHSSDPGWWAHPWNSNHDEDVDWNGTNWNGTSTIQDDIITSSSEEETATSKQNDDKVHCGEQSDNEGATWDNETVYGISGQAVSQQQQQQQLDCEEEQIPNVEAFASDRSFYHSFGGHLDDLIEAVCQKSSKEELHNQIADADNDISLRTGLLGQAWNLVNRLSYKHNQEEGRSPLAYAVAKNLKQ